MSFRVVCISRTLAAGGEVVGRRAAEELGFRYVDEEVITRAAELAKVDPKLVAKTEHRQSLLARFLDALGAQPPIEGYVPLPPDAGFYYLAGTTTVPAPVHDDLRRFIREAIGEIAAQGDVVIVAHAASLALAGRPGVLRVLVTASPPTRAQRLRIDGSIPSEDDAAAAIRDSDRERLDYLRRFYNLKDEPPTLYDLVLNTDVLRPEQTVAAIVGAARG